MEWFQVVVLALVQGLTEFLPISSSAHLILFPRLLGWQDQGLAFVIGVHLGTLLAVLGYFRNEVKLLAVAWLKTLYRRASSAEGRLAWGLVVGTIPVGLAGVLFNDLIESTLRSGLVIALSTLFFGLLLWWADARGRGQLGLEMIGWKAIVVIGLAQALALIPGTSRSGITITAGLAMGLTRQAAARYSFLLSIPVILLAGGWQAVTLAGLSEEVMWESLGLGALLAAISAFLTIHWFLKLVERVGLLPFVVYRLALGLLLLLVLPTSSA
jgi:undecaprenyl-diphosphatase